MLGDQEQLPVLSAPVDVEEESVSVQMQHPLTDLE